MSYVEVAPGAALRSSVDRFWRLEASANGDQRILPDGCVDIIIDLHTGRARVIGAMTKSVISPSRDASFLSVRFKPGAAARFLGVPVHELTDQSTELRALGRFDELERARNIDDFSAALLKRAEERTPRIEHAVNALKNGRSTSSVARELGWSRQHLRRVFQAHVGLSPKQFACVARMQQSLIFMQNDVSLAQTAADLGYADQSHLARELKLLTGATATELRAEGSILPIHSLYGPAGSVA